MYIDEMLTTQIAILQLIFAHLEWLNFHNTEDIRPREERLVHYSMRYIYLSNY